ncbi:MAG: hypothetical protein H8E44_33070 [Planctomycetes bacterium]|nr:hypothetical protein [Planctomycetota bacterium]MBL7042715.1 hypothetical protein [Pirellulaceae bacterium]
MSPVRELVAAAGMTPEILRDSTERTDSINEFNAQAGGVRQIIKGRSVEEVTPEPAEIGSLSAGEKLAAYLQGVASGERAWTIFGAGRATRMKLPSDFDRLGIAGLTRQILRALPVDESKMPAIDQVAPLIDRAATGVFRNGDDLSIIQRELFQLRYQFELLAKDSNEEIPRDDVIRHAVFIVVVNVSNRAAIAKQLAAIQFAGLDANNVYFLEQPEVGGEEISGNGTLQWYEGQSWPEGHGEPLIAMGQRRSGAYRLTDEGGLVELDKPLAAVLKDRGVKDTLFAQVNDLHLMNDIAAVERWETALKVMDESGSRMVMEMVANKVWETLPNGQRARQKGGATFVDRTGCVTMRDTVAMKTPDLEQYSRPEHISRMFYIISIDGLSQLTDDSLPAYLNVRTTSDKRDVLTREFYSGDSSSELDGRTMTEEGFKLHTFKTRKRVPEALQAMDKQDKQPGFPAITSSVNHERGIV